MTADTVGGVWTYAVELARGLAREGVEVFLATMGAPLCPDQRREADGLRVLESSYRLEWMQDPWDDVTQAGCWLRDLEARFEPDIVHLNGYAHAAEPFRAPVLVAGHSCVLSWWRAVKAEEAPPYWARYRGAVEGGLRAADFVVAPSRAMLQSLQSDYGPLAASSVIPNGREAAAFPPGEKEPLLFTAGRLWDEAKNLAAVEAVAPRLLWPVYVAGDNEHPDGSERESPLRLLGRIPAQEVARWLARASIYLLPARYEPFGLSALEAALAGCALVLGDLPSLREIWDDAACYVSPEDAGMLETKVRCLIADAALRRTMAERARSRALSFTPERMAHGYLSAYRTILAA
jgi:glycosyltransferase involved in cell wall biosynthesis